jgi:hypothetical protein
LDLNYISAFYRNFTISICQIKYSQSDLNLSFASRVLLSKINTAFTVESADPSRSFIDWYRTFDQYSLGNNSKYQPIHSSIWRCLIPYQLQVKLTGTPCTYAKLFWSLRRRKQISQVLIWGHAGSRLSVFCVNRTQMPCHQSTGEETHLPCSWAMHLKSVWSNDPKAFTHGLKGPPACKTRANTWEPPPWMIRKHWSSSRCIGGTRCPRVRPTGLNQAGWPQIGLL